MITAEQLKDVQQRTEALHRYLNIDQKQIEYEEEQLRTQAPDFWDDPKRAEAQMKKVKGIEKWLKDYKEVSTLTNELSLAVDFSKTRLSAKRRWTPFTTRLSKPSRHSNCAICCARRRTRWTQF